MFKITGDTSDEEEQANEGMFTDIIDDMLAEEVNVAPPLWFFCCITTYITK